MRNRAEDQVTLVLIRHGETKANKEGRYLGRTDESLSEDGIRALLSYKKQNYYPEIRYLFSSPMKRCLETAGILYPELSPVLIPEWREMDFGRFEYKNYEELSGNAQYQAWIDSGGVLDFPEGESRKNFLERCEKGFRRVCGELDRIREQGTERSPRAGLVVHGGVIMALLSSHGDKNYFDYQAANGRGYLCRMEVRHGKDEAGGGCVRIEPESEI